MSGLFILGFGFAVVGILLLPLFLLLRLQQYLRARKLGGLFFITVSINTTKKSWSIGPFRSQIEQINWQTEFSLILLPFNKYLYSHMKGRNTVIDFDLIKYTAVDLQKVRMLSPQEMIHQISRHLERHCLLHISEDISRN